MINPLNMSVGDTPYIDGRRSNIGQTFGWVVSLFGLGLMLLGGDEVRRVMPPLSWPAVNGEVRSAIVSSDTVAAYIGKWRNSPIVESRFHITYSYRVGGESYLGSQVDRLPAARHNANADFRRYPTGEAVLVHYDPKRPSEAVLQTPWPIRSLLTSIVGVMLLMLAADFREERIPLARSLTHADADKRSIVCSLRSLSFSSLAA
jgi:hypothetical protein